MSKLSMVLWRGIVGAFVFLAFVIPALLLDGWVVMKLWEWFILPTFTSAPSINLATGIGFSLLAGFATRTYRYDYKPESEKSKHLIAQMIFAYVGPFLAVLIGWIVQAWV